MSSKTLRFHFVLAAALVAFAAPQALAQTKGGITSTGTSTTPGGGGDPGGGAIVRYGTPGNCPPTIACGPEVRRPVVGPKVSGCSQWETVRTATGKRIRRCMDR